MITWLMTTAMGADLAGSWVLDTPKKEVRAAIATSADAAVASLPGMFQGRAKDKLKGQARICDRYTVRFSEAEVAWVCGNKDAFVVAREQLGTPFEVKKDGKRAEALITLDDSVLNAIFAGASGKRTLTLRLDGDVLVAESTLYSNKLASPLVWTSRYRREETP